jgi:hypothetical protein
MRQIHDDLWVHEDSMKLGPTDLRLRVTIARLTSGDLWVHSPTALSAELKKAVDDLGPVAAIVAPNNAHNLWLQEWDNAYPDATCYVARGIPKKLPALGDYRFIDEEAAALWSDDLAVETMDGVPFFDESAFLHRPSKSLIVTDIVQNHRGQEPAGFAKVMTKLVLEPIGFKDICIAPPLKFKFMIKDRPAFLAFINALLGWDFERIIVTHGDIIEEDAQKTLARLFARFNVH